MSKNIMTIKAARNGWSVRTASGDYLCTTVDELVKEVRAYAPVMQKHSAETGSQEEKKK